MRVTWFGHPVDVVEYQADPDVGLIAVVRVREELGIHYAPAWSLLIEAA